MNYQTTDVYRFLIYLQKYLLGDLQLFQRLSKEAEEKEKRQEDPRHNKGCINIFSFNKKHTTISTTVTTTLNPFDFEFMFGAMMISRLTIPNTAVLFATIDILGFLTRMGKNYTNTTDNYTEFFSYPKTRLNTDELPVLLNIYRHGMTHNYLPKLNMEVSYHSSNPVGKLFFKRLENRLVLNVNELEKLVVERLNEIINDSSLYVNMDRQFGIMVTDYETRSAILISNLMARL